MEFTQNLGLTHLYLGVLLKGNTPLRGASQRLSVFVLCPECVKLKTESPFPPIDFSGRHSDKGGLLTYRTIQSQNTIQYHLCMDRCHTLGKCCPPFQGTGEIYDYTSHNNTPCLTKIRHIIAEIPAHNEIPGSF